MSNNAGLLTTPVKPGSKELQALLARIAEGANERERDRIAPYEQIQWIKEAGLGRLRIPVAEGGAGASLRELFKVLIDLSAADSNVAHILRAHYWFVEQQLQSAHAESRKHWLGLVNQDKIFGNATSEQGNLAHIAPAIAAEETRRVIEVGGNIVTPGLIDLHAHVFEGFTRFGVHPDMAGVDAGVTTLVDAGSAGCATFEGFPRHI